MVRLLMVSLLFMLNLLSAATLPGGEVFAEERDLEEVKKFFERGRFGSFPDFGLMKQSIADPRLWDLVAVFFGSTADYENCQDAARAIMAKAGGQYTCTPLNK